MLPLEEIAARLKDRRPYMVAKETGLTPITISSIRDGVQQNPTQKTMQKLSDYLTKFDKS